MSRHTASISWKQDEDDHFTLGRYTRIHDIAFDGGTTIVASASPAVVKEPFSSPAAVDPEEMFVASLSSCHMLWFLDLAHRAGLDVAAYRDEAEGELARVASGKMAIVKVTLRPHVECEATPEQLAEVHEKAHEACFIANSVNTEIVVEPQA